MTTATSSSIRDPAVGLGAIPAERRVCLSGPLVLRPMLHCTAGSLRGLGGVQMCLVDESVHDRARLSGPGTDHALHRTFKNVPYRGARHIVSIGDTLLHEPIMFDA
jgi:hypothetical protein